MQNLDVKAEHLRQTLFDAIRALAEFENGWSYLIPMPDTDPPRFLALGTIDEIRAKVSGDDWKKLGPFIDEATAAKLQRDPDGGPSVELESNWAGRPERRQ